MPLEIAPALSRLLEDRLALGQILFASALSAPAQPPRLEIAIAGNLLRRAADPAVCQAADRSDPVAVGWHAAPASAADPDRPARAAYRHLSTAGAERAGHAARRPDDCAADRLRAAQPLH